MQPTMHPLSNIRPFPVQTPPLDSSQRSLLEFVSTSAVVNGLVRRRAQALLLIDEGEPFADIALLVPMPPRALQSLALRHRRAGVRAALFHRRFA